MNEKEVRRLSLELMESAEAAYLTTIDHSGYPQTRAMLNLRKKEQYPELYQLFGKHQEDFLTYFTTNTSSTKIHQIKENRKISVYYCKPSDWRGLMLSGDIEIVSDRSIKESIWQKDWELYYPGGHTDPDYAILCLRPVTARCYHQLSVAEIRF